MNKTHVIFELPSGSQADITLFNRADARYVMEAMKAQAKLQRMPPPRMVQYIAAENLSEDELFNNGGKDK